MSRICESQYRHLLALAALVISLGASNACVELIGNAKDTLVNHTGKGTHWDYSFNGDNWRGVDGAGNPWVCTTGRFQSPINLASKGAVVGRSLLGLPDYVTTKTGAKPYGNKALKTKLQYKPISNAVVLNNGHTIQVQPSASSPWDAKIVVPTIGRHVTDVLSIKQAKNAPPPANLSYVTLDVLQFHFHSDSEHQVGGNPSNLELHIVHNSPVKRGLSACSPASGCYSVVGVMIQALDIPDNEAYSAILNAAPFQEGASVTLSNVTFDLRKLLPNKTSYFAYQGSLTTPPCTEGLLWHVMTTPVQISLGQYRKFKNAIGAKACTRIGSGGDDGNDNNNNGPATVAPSRGLKIARRLLDTAEEENGDPDSWNCTLAAWDTNHRLVQPVGNRTILLASA